MDEVWGFVAMFAAVAVIIVAIASCTAIVDPKIAAARSVAFQTCVNAGQDADRCRFALKLSSN